MQDLRAARALFKAPSDTATDSLPQPAAISDVTWQNPVSGTWSTATDWSSGAVPTVSSNVTISVPGTYTVTINAPAVANALTLDNASARIVDSASLSIGTDLAIEAGTFTLASGASIVGGTISTGATGTVVLSSGATLSGVTYDGALALNAPNQTLTVADGLTLAGATGTGAGTLAITGSGANLIIQGDTTLNNAVIKLGQNVDQSVITLDEQGSAAQTLTLGPSLFLLQGNGPTAIVADTGNNANTAIANQGTLAAASAGHTFSIGAGLDGGTIADFTNSGTVYVGTEGKLGLYAASLVNTGTILVTGEYSTLVYGTTTTGTWSNQGAIAISNGGTIDFCGTFTTATLNSIAVSSGTIEIGDAITGAGPATLINTGTLSLADFSSSGTSDFVLASQGIISGGAISDPNGALFSNGGTLSGVTFLGTLNVYNELYVANGLTLASATGTGALNVEGSLVIEGGNTTLNDAVLTFDNDYGENSSLSLFEPGGGAQTLTLGSSLQLVLDSNAFLSGGFAGNDTLINQGTIVAATSQATLALAQDIDSFVSTGLIGVSNGATISIDATNFDTSGSVSVAGSLSVLTLDGNWSNTGTITDTGATLNLGGTFTTAGLDTVTDDGGSVNVSGELDNSGTIAVGTGTAFATLAVSGTISGGVIKDPHGNLAVDDGTLSGVTYEGTLALGAANACYITGGITLSGAAGTGAGAIAIDGGTLYVLDNETLNHAVITLGDGTNLGLIEFEGSGTSQILTLGPSLNLVQGGILGWLLDGTSNSATLINKGTITAGISGGLFDIDSTIAKFVNQGSVAVSNNDTMTICQIQTGSASFTNTGNISTTGKESTLAIGSMFENANFNASNGGSIGIAAGGTLTLNATHFVNSGSIDVAGSQSTFRGTEVGTSAAKTFQNTGSMAISDGGSLSLYFTKIDNTGTISVSGSTSSLSLSGPISNTGSIIVDQATLNLSGTLTTAALETITDIGGVINLYQVLSNTGATLSVGSEFDLPTINLHGDIIGGTIVETGTALTIQGGALTGVKFEGTLAVASGVTLADTGTQIGTLENAGTLDVAGGKLLVEGAVASTGSVNVATGAQLSLRDGGSFDTASNSGTIDAAGKIASFAESITGTGVLQVSSASTLLLSLGASAGQATEFLAGTGRLELGTPLDFLGILTGFTGSDKIDLLDTAATGFNFANGVLAVTGSNTTVADLHFSGAYTSSNFSLTVDGHGGSLIVWQS